MADRQARGSSLFGGMKMSAGEASNPSSASQAKPGSSAFSFISKQPPAGAATGDSPAQPGSDAANGAATQRIADGTATRRPTGSRAKKRTARRPGHARDEEMTINDDAAQARQSPRPSSTASSDATPQSAGAVSPRPNTQPSAGIRQSSPMPTTTSQASDFKGDADSATSSRPSSASSTTGASSSNIAANRQQTENQAVSQVPPRGQAVRGEVDAPRSAATTSHEASRREPAQHQASATQSSSSTGSTGGGFFSRLFGGGSSKPKQAEPAKPAPSTANRPVATATAPRRPSPSTANGAGREQPRRWGHDDTSGPSAKIDNTTNNARHSSAAASSTERQQRTISQASKAQVEESAAQSQTPSVTHDKTDAWESDAVKTSEESDGKAGVEADRPSKGSEESAKASAVKDDTSDTKAGDRDKTAHDNTDAESEAEGSLRIMGEADEKLEAISQQAEAELSAVASMFQERQTERAGVIEAANKIKAVEERLQQAIEQEDYEAAEGLEADLNELRANVDAVNVADLASQATEDGRAFLEWLVTQEESHRKRIDIYEETVSALSQRLRKQQEEFSSVKGNLEDATRHERDRIRTERLKLTRERGHLQVDLEHIEEEEARLAQLAAERTAGFQATKQSLVEELSGVQDTIRELERQLAEMREKEAMLQRDIEKEDNRIAAAQQDLAAERARVQEDRDSVDAKAKELEEKEESLNEAQRQLDDSTSTARQEIEQLDEAIGRVKSCIQQATTSKSSYEQRVKRIQALAVEKDTNLSKEGDVSQLPHCQTASVLAEHAASWPDFATKKAAAAAKAAEVQEVSLKALELQQDLTNKTKLLKDIEDLLPSLEQGKKLAVTGRNFKEAGRVANEIKEKEQEREDLNQQVQTVEAALEESTNRLEQLREEARDLQAEVDGSEREFDRGLIDRLADLWPPLAKAAHRLERDEDELAFLAKADAKLCEDVLRMLCAKHSIDIPDSPEVDDDENDDAEGEGVSLISLDDDTDLVGIALDDVDSGGGLESSGRASASQYGVVDELLDLAYTGALDDDDQADEQDDGTKEAVNDDDGAEGDAKDNRELARSPIVDEAHAASDDDDCATAQNAQEPSDMEDEPRPDASSACQDQRQETSLSSSDDEAQSIQQEQHSTAADTNETDPDDDRKEVEASDHAESTASDNDVDKTELASDDEAEDTGGAANE